jgi:hypothetical protein
MKCQRKYFKRVFALRFVVIEHVDENTFFVS